MGASHSNGLSEEGIKEIKGSTKFTIKEIREMYEKFHTDFPDGIITRDRFIHMYAGLFPDGDASQFAKHVFRAYDGDGNGVIDFQEFMMTLSIAAKGTVEEKSKWAFHMYDINGDGSVSRPEATEMIMAIYRMQGIEHAEEKAEQAALQLFIHLKKNVDEELSEDEFVFAVRHSPIIQDLLQ